MKISTSLALFMTSVLVGLNGYAGQPASIPNESESLRTQTNFSQPQGRKPDSQGTTFNATGTSDEECVLNLVKLFVPWAKSHVGVSASTQGAAQLKPRGHDTWHVQYSLPHNSGTGGRPSTADFSFRTKVMVTNVNKKKPIYSCSISEAEIDVDVET